MKKTEEHRQHIKENHNSITNKNLELSHTPEVSAKIKKTNTELFGKRVLCVDNGMEFDCIRDAARWLGDLKYSCHIGEVARGHRKTAYGYSWKFIAVIFNNSKRRKL